MADDKRKSQRAPTNNLRVYFGVRDADHRGVAQDISETGLRLRAPKGYPKDTTLVLHIEVPGHGSVRAKGLITRVRKVPPTLPPNEPVEMGIVIVEGNKLLSEMVKKLIADFREMRGKRRKEIQLPVSIGNIRRLVREYTQNIGEGGMFAVTDHPPNPGDTVETLVVLPEPFGEIRVECKVVHVVLSEQASQQGRLPGCGLQLVDFAPGDAEKYSAFLKQLHGADGS